MAEFLINFARIEPIIMKKTLLFFFLVTALVTLSSSAFSQNMSSSYRTSVGAKGYFGNGSIAGINIKHFLKGSSALEGSLLFRNGFVGFEGVYEWHGDISGADGLKWYVGPGAWLGFYNNRGGGNSSAMFALKGAVGLDYKFSGAPINVAFDLNPTFSLTPVTDFDFFAGFAFRFAF